MIDRQVVHDRVDEILNDHFPSMMGRNGVDVSLKEFVDQIIDQAYLQGVVDEREKSSIAPATYPTAKQRKAATNAAETSEV